MKLVVACNDFSSMLSRLQGFLGKSQLSPILSNVLLEAKANMTPLSAKPTDEIMRNDRGPSAVVNW